MGMNPAEYVWKVAKTANSNLYGRIRGRLGRARARCGGAFPSRLTQTVVIEPAEWRNPISSDSVQWGHVAQGDHVCATDRFHASRYGSADGDEPWP